MKLTRKQIKEGLEQVPIDVVLVGAAAAKEKAITPKQREFARQVALGETQAGAYRKAISPKAKSSTANREGHRLAKKPQVITMTEAFKAAIEAEKLRTPAHLRALTIQQLTEHALNENFPPAQRVKSLELLGKITEVALFTERREVVQVHDSQEIRQRLLNSLRLAMQSNSIEADAAQAGGLLDEIKGRSSQDQHSQSAALGLEHSQLTPAAAQNLDLEDPPTAHALEIEQNPAAPLLSNPHTQSLKNSAMSDPTITDVTDVTNLTITPVIVTNPNEINDLQGQSSLTSSDTAVMLGGVGAKISGGFENVNPGNAPLSDLVPSGNWK